MKKYIYILLALVLGYKTCLSTTPQQVLQDMRVATEDVVVNVAIHQVDLGIALYEYSLFVLGGIRDFFKSLVNQFFTQEATTQRNLIINSARMVRDVAVDVVDVVNDVPANVQAQVVGRTLVGGALSVFVGFLVYKGAEALGMPKIACSLLSTIANILFYSAWRHFVVKRYIDTKKNEEQAKKQAGFIAKFLKKRDA